MCRPDHQVANLERLKSAIQNGGRKVRAVTVERDGTLSASGSKLCEHRNQPSRQPLPVLRDDWYCPAQKIRHFIAVRRGAHYRHLHAGQ
jgi:hypothetical protein